jgi:multidrug efflux pump subunit AcrB|tara:strand:+ start:179 stop:577 length:399 start_codon:yes stop_codon:yes gene_type:complete
MEIVNNIFKRTRKNPIGKIMIDESMRPISSRETVQDYMNYQNKRKAQIAQEKKEQFEESLRQSAVREVKSGSSLFGASKNIFEQQLTKDIAVSLDDMEQRKRAKLEVNKMIDDMTPEMFKRYQGHMIAFNLR